MLNTELLTLISIFLIFIATLLYILSIYRKLNYDNNEKTFEINLKDSLKLLPYSYDTPFRVVVTDQQGFLVDLFKLNKYITTLDVNDIVLLPYDDCKSIFDVIKLFENTGVKLPDNFYINLDQLDIRVVNINKLRNDLINLHPNV